jgi:transcriptional regulator with XRE-family HTH domain
MSMPSITETARERFARNLRIWRAARGFSQQYLAEQADLSRVYISKVENSAASVSIDTMEKLAVVLAIDIADLLAAHVTHTLDTTVRRP